MKKLIILLLLNVLLIGVLLVAQTNPAAHDLSSTEYSFTGFASGTITSYPTSMQGWSFSAEPTSTTYSPASNDRALVVSTTGATTGGIRNEIGLGLSLLNSSTNNIGAIAIAINTTARMNVTVSWTAADMVATATRVNGLKLQYRIGTSGDFTDVAGTDYISSGTSQAAAANFSNITLPAEVDNKAYVQLRWLYYFVSGTSGRDRIRLDEVAISSSPAAGMNFPPTISGVSTNPTGSILSTESVSVIATITDSDGSVTSASVKWGTSTGSYPYEIDMTSSGSLYTTETDIPAQPAGTTVFYVVTAVDDDSDVSTTIEMSYGVINPPAPNPPTATMASGVASDSFTANWDSVSGASGYLLDVYTIDSSLASDLFFSEYIEGSSSNKAIEIFNGTGYDVDLSDYTVYLYANGSSTPTNTEALTGTLSSGDAYVIANSGANSTILGLADITSTVTYFGGNDAFALWKESTSSYVDIFGSIGTPYPTTAWGTAPLTTINQTLVRKISVTSGVSENPTPPDFPSLATEWDSYPIDTTSYLGSHSLSSATYVTGYHNLDVGNVTTYNVTGLDPETTYYYVVRAYDVYDQSSPNSNEISVTTTAAPASVVINADGTATGAAIVSGGSIPESLLGADSGAPAVVYTITSTGVKDVTVYKTAAFAGDWYCWLNTPGGLIAGANPIQAANFYIFEDVNFDAKGDVVVIINDNSTLPVELSSFTATLSAQNLVSLMWITQSETGVSGYYIYRGIDTNASTAQIVSPLITATNTSTTQSYVYVDSEIFETGTYYYWLQNVDIDGTTDFHGPIRLDYVAGQNNGTPNIPVVTELKNVYPNPFNPIAFISYSLTENNPVAIKIYNNRGQLVRVLDNAPATAGNHRIEWNGMDNSGNACSTGLYLVRMTAGNKTFTQKVVLVK